MYIIHKIEIQTNTHYNSLIEKKTQSAHPHAQHTDSHTNTAAQYEKWVYCTH